MITAGYMGAVSVVTTVKWFWFLFGMAMFLPVIYSLARTFRETVITRKDPEMIELYGKIAWLTIIMWSFYPVVWLFSEGFASFSVSFEVCRRDFFGILSVYWIATVRRAWSTSREPLRCGPSKLRWTRKYASAALWMRQSCAEANVPWPCEE